MREVNRAHKDTDSAFIKPHEKYQLVKAAWPPIINRELFDAAQAALDDNKRQERARLAKAESRIFLLSKILRCAECDRPLVGQSAHGENRVHRYYSHNPAKGDVVTCRVRRIRADEIEEAVIQHVTTALRDGKYLESIAKRMTEGADQLRSSTIDDTNLLAKRVAELDVEIACVFRMQVGLEGNPTALRLAAEQLERLGKLKEACQKEAEHIAERASNVVSLSDVREDLASQISRIQRGWSRLTPAIKKRSLRALFKEIRCGSDGLAVTYYSNALRQVHGTAATAIGPRAEQSIALAGDGPGNLKFSVVKNCVSADMVDQSRIELPTSTLRT